MQSRLALVLCLGFWSMSMPALAQSAEVSLSASASRVAVGEPFVVEVRAAIDGGDADALEIPDFGALEVLGRRVSRPFSFSFGFGSGGQRAVMKSQVVHTFTLRAREEGSYHIAPAVVVLGRRKFRSQPLVIEASGRAMPGAQPGLPPLPGLPGAGLDPDQASDDDLAKPPDGPLDGAKYDGDMFVRTVVDRKQPYVGEQTTVTVYLYVRGRLQQTPSVTREPTAEGFWVQDLLPAQRSLSFVRQEVNGRAFNVYVLRRFAAFPLRPGSLKVGAVTVEVGGGNSLFDLLSGPAAPTRRSGVNFELEARALPPRTGTAPVHVGALKLEASVEPKQARVGDAVTIAVSARGTGNLKALQLAAPVLANAEVLPPEIDDELTTDLDQVGGVRTFRWLVLPRAPGTLVVPPFSVQVLDPAVGQYATAQSAAISLPVTGVALPAAAVSDSKGDAADEVPHFGPARTHSALARRQVPLDQRPWFPYALGAGPLLFVALLAVRFGRRALNARRDSTSGSRKFREAQLKLDEARSLAERGEGQASLGALAAALKRALEARLEEPVGGLTRAALRSHLIGRGMAQPLAERLVTQLEGAELARFDPAPKSKNELATEVEKARGVLRELERFVPRGAR